MINGMCFIDDSNVFLDSCTSTGNFDFRFCWHSFHFNQSKKMNFRIFVRCIVVVTVTVVSEYSNVNHTQISSIAIDLKQISNDVQFTELYSTHCLRSKINRHFVELKKMIENFKTYILAYIQTKSLAKKLSAL